MNRDFVGDQKHTEQRIRDLQVGTHPTIVQPDAFGRNTPWKRITTAVPFVESGGVEQAGLYRCVRADILIFKTIGGGLAIGPRKATDDPEYLFTTGKTGKSADSHRFVAFMGPIPVQMVAKPNGDVYCTGTTSPLPGNFAVQPLIFAEGWSLG